MSFNRFRRDDASRRGIVGSTRSWLTFLLAVIATIYLGTEANADHGSWTNHDLEWTAQWTDSYEGYSDIAASDYYDYGHAVIEVYEYGFTTLLVQEYTTCGVVNEGCSYRKSPTVSWGSNRSVAGTLCAYDGAHELWGSASAYPPCSTKGLDQHTHTANF